MVALLLMGVGLAAYGHTTGYVDLSPLGRFVSQVAALDWLEARETTGGPRLMDASGSEPASYTEGAGATARKLAGRALWQTRIERPAGREAETVLTLDVRVPERGLSLALSMRPDTSANAAMSHLVELRFTGSQGFSVDQIANVLGITFKSARDPGGSPLAGQLVKVAPGLFLFGLSGDTDQTRRNVELLRTRPRLEISMSFTNGRTAVIAIEKGTSGERVFAEAFSKWVR